MDLCEKMVRKVWRKGRAPSGVDFWRKDDCGAWMLWRHHGDTDSEYGWVIQDDSPPGLSGDITFMKPVHWANAGCRSCKVTADSVNNIYE